jgi:hypothetical protein
MPATGIEIATILKALGAFGGAIMSFAFVPAFTIRTIAIRFGISAPSGYIMADSAVGWLRLPDNIEHPSLVGGFLAGIFSWFVLSAIVRLAQTISWENLPWFKKK